MLKFNLILIENSLLLKSVFVFNNFSGVVEVCLINIFIAQVIVCHHVLVPNRTRFFQHPWIIKRTNDRFKSWRKAYLQRYWKFRWRGTFWNILKTTNIWNFEFCTNVTTVQKTQQKFWLKIIQLLKWFPSNYVFSK